MRSLVIAALAATTVAAAAPAHADVDGLVRYNDILIANKTAAVIKLADGGADTLNFTAVAPAGSGFQRFQVTYSAECTFGAVDALLDIDITVDGVALHPTARPSGEVFCGLKQIGGTPATARWTSVGHYSVTAMGAVTPGPHKIQVKARLLGSQMVVLRNASIALVR